MADEGAEERPELVPGLDVRRFRAHYWLKSELEDFAHREGMSADGSKAELTARVEHLLETGAIPEEDRVGVHRPWSTTPPPGADEPSPTLDEVIRLGVRDDEEHRAFFARVIGPGFAFTDAFLAFCREEAGRMTYADAVTEWHRQRRAGVGGGPVR